MTLKAKAPKFQLVLMDGFAAQPGDAPPTEFLLFKKGKHTSEKGSFVFDDASAKSVLKGAERKGHDFPIDYEHLMLSEKPAGDGPTPAAGWFKVEVREDGLWATDVRWTDRARTYLTAKEYRFMSPAFTHKDGHIEELINVALVNLPAQHHQTPLVAAKDDEITHEVEETKMETLLALLKLSKSASEAEATQVAQKIIQERAKLLTALGKEDVDEALGVVAALKASQTQLADANKALLVMKNEQRMAKVLRIVEQGIKDKKFAPTMKDEWIAQGMAKNGIKFLRGVLETSQPLVSTKGHKPKVPAAGEQEAAQLKAKAEITEIAKKLNVKAEDLIKQMGLDSEARS